MYPDLSYVFQDLFGTQPDNALSVVKIYGLCLVFAFIGAAIILHLEIRRKYSEGKLGQVFISNNSELVQKILGNSLLVGFSFYKLFNLLFLKDLNWKVIRESIFSWNGNIISGLIAFTNIMLFYLIRHRKELGNTEKKR